MFSMTLQQIKSQLVLSLSEATLSINNMDGFSFMGRTTCHLALLDGSMWHTPQNITLLTKGSGRPSLLLWLSPSRTTRQDPETSL